MTSNVFSLVYQEALFRPLLNLLVGITGLMPTHSVGLAIIVVTGIVRLILLPFSLHQARHLYANQTKMAQIQQELQRVQKQFKNDRSKQAEATMALYRRAGINPASGCLPLLIQLPILLALYRVFLVGVGVEAAHLLYSFVSLPDPINLQFLAINLNQPSLRLAVLAGISQFILMRFTTPPQPTPQPGLNEDSAQMMASMQRNMAYVFPAMTVFISLQLPAALALYWVASTVFAGAQQYVMKKKFHLTGTLPAV